MTLSAIVAAGLLWIQFSRAKRRRDLLLLAAVSTVALSDFAFNALPAVGGYQLGTHGMGARLAGQLLATGAFTTAAFVASGHRVAGGGRRLAWFAVLASLCGIGGAQLLGAIVGPSGINATEGYRPVLEAAATLSCAGLLLAGWRFTARPRASGGQGTLLGGAAFLFAAASLQRMALPLTPTDWVTPADMMRLVAYAFLLVAALRLCAGTRSQMAAAAVSAERLKIAHDLHDGLAQDLALIAAHSERLERDFGVKHPLVIAAKRALSVSRGQILDLAADPAASTPVALRVLADEFEERYDVHVSVSVLGDGDGPATASQRQELLRIVREATANAVNHGGARHIAVTLGSADGKLLLRVCDDGCGLDSPAAAANPGTGLGMSMMRSRAEALGASLVARRGDVGGTQLELVTGRGR
jgi:signal transduction histidine kinase